MKKLWTGLALMSAVRSVAALGAMTGGCTGTTTTVVVADAGINCGAGSIECGGSCTAVARDAENCGSCGKKCASGEVCSAGACASACGSGTTKCGNECVDTKTDDRNCGACGTKCSGIEVCNAGACAPGCSQGQMKCGSSCVDNQTDRTNCGACGTVCKDGENCSAGKCGVSCQAGLTKCTAPVVDGGVSDGGSGDASTLGATFCANLQVDNANCGACGTPCSGNAKCVAGSCVAPSTVRLTAGNEIPVTFVTCGTGTAANCTAAVAVSSCQAIGKKLVSHASNGNSGIVSLGGTVSCSYSISYFVNNDPSAAGKCLVGVSNLQWSGGCCAIGNWHGNVVPIPATLGQQFGYVSVSNTGYNGSLTNTSGVIFACVPEAQAPPVNNTCNANGYVVACN